MVTLLLRLLPMLCGGHHQVALENLALRHQLAVYKKTVNRPKLLSSDRLFWVAWSRVWAGWRHALVIVSPNTVLRWQRRRFRKYWARLSARPAAGRPRVSRQIRALVGRMAQANPLGRASHPWRTAEARNRGGRAYGRPAALDAAHTAVSDVANVPRQPCPGPSLHRFLHSPHRGLSGTLCPCRARSPSPAGHPLQRDRASHLAVDGPADRGRLPERHRAVISPPRSRPSLRRALPAPSEGPADRGRPHDTPQSLAESLRGTAHRLGAARLPRPYRRPR